MPQRPRPERHTVLDETVTKASLNNILDQIVAATNKPPELVRNADDSVHTHPELDRSDYWMGKISFDPAHADQSYVAGETGISWKRFLEHHGYGIFFHHLSTPPLPNTDPAMYEAMTTGQRSSVLCLAREVTHAWRKFRNILFHQEIIKALQALDFSQLQGERFKAQCSDWIRSIMLQNIILKQNMSSSGTHQTGVDSGWRRRMGGDMFPLKSRPDIHFFNQDYSYGMDVELDKDIALNVTAEETWKLSRSTRTNWPLYTSRLLELDPPEGYMKKNKVSMNENGDNMKEKEPDEIWNPYRSETLSLQQHTHIWAPILNADDLSRPEFMISFLYHRATHHPAHFASRDFEASYIGRAGRMNDFLLRSWLPDSWELSEDEGYFRFVERPENGDVTKKAAKRDAEARGRLYTHLEIVAILESQMLIYGFLKKFIMWLVTNRVQHLENTGQTSLYHVFPDVENPPEELEAFVQEKTSLQEPIISNQPAHDRMRALQYAEPDATVVDFDVWKATIESLRDAARVKLRSLMRDPEAFLAEAKIVLDHHPGQVIRHDTMKKTRHFDTGKRRRLAKSKWQDIENELAANVMSRIAYTAIRDVEVWEHLLSITRRVRDEVVASCVDLGDFDTPLEGRLRELWLLLVHSLRSSFKHVYVEFQKNSIWACSPPGRAYHVRTGKGASSAGPPLREVDAFPWLMLDDKDDGEFLGAKAALKEMRNEVRSLKLGGRTLQAQVKMNQMKSFEERLEQATTDKMKKQGLVYKDSDSLKCKDNSLTQFLVAVRSELYHEWMGEGEEAPETEETTSSNETAGSDDQAPQAAEDDGQETNEDPGRPLFSLATCILPHGKDLSYIGMTNMGEAIRLVEQAEAAKGIKTFTPYVRQQLKNLTTLSQMVDDMERTRRIPFPQAQRLRQEFEDSKGSLSKYVFGPSSVLERLEGYVLGKGNFNTSHSTIRELLEPLLKSIDDGVPVDAEGGLVYDLNTWHKVLPPSSRGIHLDRVWRSLLNSLFPNSARTTNDFGRAETMQFLTTAINSGNIGLGLARFLAEFAREDEERRMEEEKRRADEASIPEQIRLNQEDCPSEDEDVEMKDGTDDGGPSSGPSLSPLKICPSPNERIPRQRPIGTAYMKRRKEHSAKMRGRRELGIDADPSMPEQVEKKKLASCHWDTFAALFGKNDTIDFGDLRRAMGGIGFAVTPAAVGSAWQLRWTEASSLPPPRTRLSIVVHDFHGAAGRATRIACLNVGRRLREKLGITRQRLHAVYEGGPNGGWM